MSAVESRNLKLKTFIAAAGAMTMAAFAFPSASQAAGHAHGPDIHRPHAVHRVVPKKHQVMDKVHVVERFAIPMDGNSNGPVLEVRHLSNGETVLSNLARTPPINVEGGQVDIKRLVLPAHDMHPQSALMIVRFHGTYNVGVSRNGLTVHSAEAGQGRLVAGMAKKAVERMLGVYNHFTAKVNIGGRYATSETRQFTMPALRVQFAGTHAAASGKQAAATATPTGAGQAIVPSAAASPPPVTAEAGRAQKESAAPSAGNAVAPASPAESAAVVDHNQAGPVTTPSIEAITPTPPPSVNPTPATEVEAERGAPVLQAGTEVLKESPSVWHRIDKRKAAGALILIVASAAAAALFYRRRRGLLSSPHRMFAGRERQSLYWTDYDSGPYRISTTTRIHPVQYAPVIRFAPVIQQAPVTQYASAIQHAPAI